MSSAGVGSPHNRAGIDICVQCVRVHAFMRLSEPQPTEACTLSPTDSEKICFELLSRMARKGGGGGGGWRLQRLHQNWLAVCFTKESLFPSKEETNTHKHMERVA